MNGPFGERVVSNFRHALAAPGSKWARRATCPICDSVFNLPGLLRYVILIRAHLGTRAQPCFVCSTACSIPLKPCACLIGFTLQTIKFYISYNMLKRHSGKRLDGKMGGIETGAT